MASTMMRQKISWGRGSLTVGTHRFAPFLEHSSPEVDHAPTHQSVSTFVCPQKKYQCLREFNGHKSCNRFPHFLDIFDEKNSKESDMMLSTRMTKKLNYYYR
jgi:hypothetical protein